MHVGKVEVTVQEIVLKSGWDTFLIAAPFIGLLLATVFRLDEVFASNKREVRRRSALCGTDENGEPLFSDPDGRLWRSPRAGSGS
ncbi:MAG TPA: hypothetical protein VMA34_17445 [Terracidiphilus sp.]|nr:hypothetical protein [Terracidiphilus sp.]